MMSTGDVIIIVLVCLNVFRANSQKLKPKEILGSKADFFLFLNMPMPLLATAPTALSIGVIRVSMNFMFSFLLSPYYDF